MVADQPDGCENEESQLSYLAVNQISIAEKDGGCIAGREDGIIKVLHLIWVHLAY